MGGKGSGVGREKGKGERIEDCWSCGDYIADSDYLFARNERDHYCSLACWHKDHPLDITVRTCINCSDEFDVPTSQLRYRPAKYCSRKCYREYTVPRNQVTLKCEQCGDEFTVARSTARHNPAKFCSRACSNRSRTGIKRGPYKKRSKDAQT
jgi:hypothetical protein